MGYSMDQICQMMYLLGHIRYTSPQDAPPNPQ
jgi:hypothetical protein